MSGMPALFSASRVGLMLYTVRAECAADLAGTLRAVAEMGYNGVELFDLHGHSARQVREWLDELGLTPCSRHVSLAALESELPALAADAEPLGTNRIVLAWVEPPVTTADARSLAERLAYAADEASRLGLELGFHNHDGELQPLDGGPSFLDALLELPVFLELDLGWAWWAGIDPVELLERTRGRVPLVHIKDFRSRGERSFCPVGDGRVGYERVAPAAAAAGVEWLLVEQDETDGPALEAAQRSLRSLNGILVNA
jgi:sugar phosphate isomerase/epimerase